MIRPCNAMDVPVMLEIINDAARAYRGVIPADCWTEPYMSEDELRREIEDGVQFRGVEQEGHLVAVMGIQHVRDVSLLRHAYVRTVSRQKGFGGELLGVLRVQTSKPLLVGTWAAAVLGRTLLRETRVSPRHPGREGRASEEILEHQRPAGGNVGCAGR